jgi:hypothetical protein
MIIVDVDVTQWLAQMASVQDNLNLDLGFCWKTSYLFLLSGVIVFHVFVSFYVRNVTSYYFQL